MTRDEAIELIRRRDPSIFDVFDEINLRTSNGEFGDPVNRVAEGEATIRLVIEKFSKGKGRE